MSKYTTNPMNRVTATPAVSTPMVIERGKKCWWCHQPAYNIMGCPMKLVGGVLHSHGLFCSPECVKGYIEVQTSQEYNSSLQLLHKMTGLSMIRATPHYTLLEEYGGPLPIDEYKKGTNEYKPQEGYETMLTRQYNISRTMF